MWKSCISSVFKLISNEQYNNNIQTCIYNKSIRVLVCFSRKYRLMESDKTFCTLHVDLSSPTKTRIFLNFHWPFSWIVRGWLLLYMTKFPKFAWQKAKKKLFRTASRKCNFFYTIGKNKTESNHCDAADMELTGTHTNSRSFRLAELFLPPLRCAYGTRRNSPWLAGSRGSVTPVGTHWNSWWVTSEWRVGAPSPESIHI